MTTVLAAIDNSAAAQPVLIAAKALARLFDASVQAIHVADEEGDTARACADHCAVPFARLSGEPLRQIAAEAATGDVVAVAVGTRNQLKGRRTGHLARAVANTVDKPVLVVPPDAVPAERFHTVLIAIEGTAAKARSIRAAVDIASGTDLDVVVVHVDDEASIPSFSDQTAHETDAYAKEFLARYLHGVDNVRFEPRIGEPVEEILGASHSINADLLALGWPHSTDERRGVVARQILDRSDVPVLLVALAH